MLDRIHELARERVDFAFETTLASRSFAPWIRRLRTEGYVFELVFLWLSSAELAVARVAERVRSGGHAVSEEVVRRRYHRGGVNFFRLYRPLADGWHFFDNSGDAPARLVAEGCGMGENRIENAELWEELKRQWA